MNHETPFSAFDVCAIVGITYRQCDYWVRIGIIDATKPADGSGSQRRFSRADISDIALIDAVRKWVWSPHRAAELIGGLRHDALRASGQVTIKLDGPVALVVDIDELERILDERISAAFPEERATA